VLDAPLGRAFTPGSKLDAAFCRLTLIAALAVAGREHATEQRRRSLLAATTVATGEGASRVETNRTEEPFDLADAAMLFRIRTAHQLFAQRELNACSPAR
jgi:hypothetical protein